jgi:hypothetical protein
LVGSLGRLNVDFSGLVDQVKPIVGGLINQVLVQILGSLQGLIGGMFSSLSLYLYIDTCVGRASIDFGAIFSGFLSEIQGTVTSLGQHILNQGLSAVIGGLGSLGGSRAIGDIFSCECRSIDGR